ncbi:hypothetical protein AMTRI_Chr01g105500 [Amborella trichopoda]
MMLIQRERDSRFGGWICIQVSSFFYNFCGNFSINSALPLISMKFVRLHPNFCWIFIQQKKICWTMVNFWQACYVPHVGWPLVGILVKQTATVSLLRRSKSPISGISLSLFIHEAPYASCWCISMSK